VKKWYTLSTHRLLDINVTKNVHSTLQQIDPARSLKKSKEQVLPTRDVLLLFCMFALRKDERKLQYSRCNILGFIVSNTGYFTSDNVPDGIKNATHNTFSNSRKKLANEIKISSFFRKWLNTNKRLIFNA
jgi:hypothetical protein